MTDKPLPTSFDELVSFLTKDQLAAAEKRAAESIVKLAIKDEVVKKYIRAHEMFHEYYGDER